MRGLDERLVKMFSRVDTRPGFEQRLEARIAGLRASRARLSLAERKAALRRQRELAREAARREAWLEGLTLTAAGAGAVLATWMFAPRLMSLAAGMTSQGDAAWLGLASLAAVAAVMWLLLRRSGIEPRSLIGA